MISHHASLVFQILTVVVFLITAVAGVYLFRNYQKLFGVDPNMPSENASSRTYTKVMVFTVWAHLLILSGAAALLME